MPSAAVAVRVKFKISAIKSIIILILSYLLVVLGFNDTSTLVGHFVSSPREREKRDRRDSIQEMKERDREERETRMKVKKQKKYNKKKQQQQNIPPLTLPAARIAGLAQLEANISWTPRWHDTWHLRHPAPPPADSPSPHYHITNKTLHSSIYISYTYIVNMTTDIATRTVLKLMHASVCTFSSCSISVVRKHWRKQF